MNRPLKTQVPASKALPTTSAGTRILQRKCACGDPAGLAGQCEECRGKQPANLQSDGARAKNGFLSIGDEALRSSGLKSNSGTRGMTDLGIGHEFSQVPVHTSSNAAMPGRGLNDAIPGSRPIGDTGGIERAIEELKSREFHCPPAPESVAAIGSAFGTGTLGATKIDKSSKLICFPEFDVKEKEGYCTFKPRPISLSTTSKYAKSESDVPLGITMPNPECGNKQVPVFTTVTPEISKWVEAGEQEHCDDINLAFTQTLKPCAATLQNLSGQRLKGKNEDECYRALVAKLGFDPLDCTQEFITLNQKTGERDSKGWHDFDPVVISKSCQKIVFGNKKSASNKIGDAGVAPSKHIPAASKCGVSTPASTPSSAPAPSSPPSSTPAPPTPAPPAPSPKSEFDGGSRDPLP